MCVGGGGVEKEEKLSKILRICKREGRQRCGLFSNAASERGFLPAGGGVGSTGEAGGSGAEPGSRVTPGTCWQHRCGETGTTGRQGKVRSGGARRGLIL